MRKSSRVSEANECSDPSFTPLKAYLDIVSKLLLGHLRNGKCQGFKSVKSSQTFFFFKIIDYV